MTAWRVPSPHDANRYDAALVFEAGLRNHHVSNTAYPIAHDDTWGPYRVPRPRHREVIEAAWTGVTDLCLYVHIPFCHTRCSFCEYTVVNADDAARADVYVDALMREFELYRAPLGRRRLHGFDIGGGTPSFINTGLIQRIVARARSDFEFAPGADISIETTPRIAAAEPDKIHEYRRVGIDRISMGVQVIQPDLLRVLNRDGNGLEHHQRAVDNIRRAGFARMNIDLMYGFQGQSEASWAATLAHAIALGPEYITLYRMRYKLTRISPQARQVSLDQVRAHQRIAKEALSAAGFKANPGKTTYSRIPGDVGTSAYLHRRVVDGMPYLGLGLGSQSLTNTTISYNDGAVAKNLAPYLRSIDAGRLPVQDLYDLPARQMMGKMCAVSFYFGEIDSAAFEAKFGVRIEDAFAPEIEFVLRRGLMEWTGRAISLTPEGVAQQAGVIALFFAPSIQRYLLSRDPDAAEDFDRNRLLAVRVAARSKEVSPV